MGVEIGMRKSFLTLLGLTLGTLLSHSQPLITNQPQSQVILSGGTVVFNVGVSNSEPTAYQWQFNGSNLPTSFITTVAGGGTNYPGRGLQATNVSFVTPYGVAVDKNGSLLVACNDNFIRKVDTNGVMTIFAGTGSFGYAGDGAAATNAQFAFPQAVVIDKTGNVYIGDTQSQRVRRVGTNGIITTYAGNGSAGSSGDGGNATNGALGTVSGLALDQSNNLFIACYTSCRVRKVGTNGIITTVAGIGVAGYTGDGGLATSARLVNPQDVTVDGVGNIFIAEAGGHVRKVATNGIITTVAGHINGSSGYGGDGGQATNALLKNPECVRLDSVGNLLIADGGNQRVRQVNTSGIITTIVGGGGNIYSGDGFFATSAGLTEPAGLAFDKATNLLVVDYGNNRIRKVYTVPASLPTLTLTGITVSNSGYYSVIISNSTGNVTSSIASLTVLIPNNPPVITTQPVGITVTNGDVANFNVTSSGPGLLRFQWLKCAGRTATAVPVVFPNGIVYSATVTSGGAGYNSVPKVRFIGGSGINAGGTAVISGGNVTGINVTNSGFSYFAVPPMIEIDSPAVSASALSDQTNSTLTLAAVAGADMTNYFAVVTNNYGSVTSRMVGLTVILPPQSFAAKMFGGGLQLQLVGTPNYPYLVQSATNLTPPIDWQPLVTKMADANGNWIFTTLDLTNAPALFYRAVRQ